MVVRLHTGSFSHVLERIGLATAGASCGLFVAAYLAKNGTPLFESIGFFLLAMLCGAIGFYIGIDMPRRDLHNVEPKIGGVILEADPVETLSAIGTFAAPVAALVAVSHIVLDINSDGFWVPAIGGVWLAGVILQIAAGVFARLGR
ncbi:hypothetical protein [Bradyrhizobium sp. 2TAF24]|uniref:hypothetical protein n=1 Tax=Bradyrhizobium sp. 2TAF24 TaxID=3233011 RepID=UPI003F90C523